MVKKLKSTVVPLDLNNCQPLTNLQPVPKSRRSSITSVESTNSDGSVTLVEKLQLPPIREFDDLEQFEQFVRDETWDNEFDYFHAKLKYYPPFILKECKNDLDKIKSTSNKNSKKFKRQLNHHVKNHLFKDLEKCSGYPLNLENVGMEETTDKVVWKYNDSTNHGFDEEAEALNRKWSIDVEVKCNNENAMVEVDYKSLPKMELL